MWFHAHNLFILISCIVECIIFFPLIYSLRNGNKSTLPLIILRNLKCLFCMLISGRKPSTNENITKYPCQLSHYAVVKNKKSPSLSVVTLCSSKKQEIAVCGDRTHDHVVKSHALYHWAKTAWCLIFSYYFNFSSVVPDQNTYVWTWMFQIKYWAATVFNILEDLICSSII
jgi:hypothetical protein